MKKIVAFSLLILFWGSWILCSDAEEYKPLAIKKHNEGVVFYDKRQYSSAIECFLEAVQEDPSFADSYYNLGVLYEYFGEKPKAMTAYKQLLKLDPYNPQAAYKIAEIYCGEKNYKVALNYLVLVPKNSPVYKEALTMKQSLQRIVSNEKPQNNIFMPSVDVYSGIPSPSGIIKDGLGNLYISDFSKNAITRITSSGKNVFYRGAPLSGPMGLAVDAYNNLYVASYNSGKIILVGQDGVCQVILSGLNRPHDLFIDNENNLFVTEQGRNKVVKYKLY